jgi:hypothetical protein
VRHRDRALDLRHRGLELGHEEGRAREPGAQVRRVEVDAGIRARDHHDAVLAAVLDHDQRGARGFGGIGAQGLGVDAVAFERLAQRAAVVVVAHAADHAHLRALARAAHGLVGALAAGDGGEGAAQQGLARGGRMRHAQHQVHVEAAEHHDARCRGAGGRRRAHGVRDFRVSAEEGTDTGAAAGAPE